MITVTTGVPGSGKTLFTIQFVRDLAEKDNRPVFYSGIKDLQLPWIEHDPTQWMDLPPNAIMVIDECQRVFRPRGNGAAVPPYVSEMETHRHKGIDLFLVTQHPMLIDQNIRRLTGRHFHVHRIFGMHAATIHEWPQIKDNCDKSRSDSVQRKWRYPKDVFKLYKSAEAHTHKVNIPYYVWVLLALILFCCFLGYRFYSSRMAALQPASVDGAPPIISKAPPGSFASGGPRAAPMTAAEWAEQYRPRVEGLVYTAPVYDKVTSPVRAPYPAACVQSKSRCQCYTQQGTKLETSPQLCSGIVAGGFFIAWDERSGSAVPQPVPQPAREVLAGGNVDGLINLTPGHASRNEVVTVAQADRDGAGVRAARKARQ